MYLLVNDRIVLASTFYYTGSQKKLWLLMSDNVANWNATSMQIGDNEDVT